MLLISEPSLGTQISKFKLVLIFGFIDFEISKDSFLHKCKFMKTLTWIANKLHITIISKIPSSLETTYKNYSSQHILRIAHLFQ